jgi:hypothetical protein
MASRRTDGVGVAVARRERWTGKTIGGLYRVAFG